MKVADLVQDKRNANRGTKRGREAVVESLKRYRAGRSLLVDRNDVVIAGNKTAAGALAAGITDAIVVETDGTKLVVVKRTDLDINDSDAQALAIADNRVAEVGLEWDKEKLADLCGSGDLELKPFFTDEELADAMGLGSEGLTPPPDEVPEGNYQSQYGVIVICASENAQQDVFDRLTSEGFKCRVVVT